MSFGAPYPAAKREISRTFLAHAETTSTAASFNFAGLSFGAANTERYLVACIAWQSTLVESVTGCTIGGVTASEVVQSALSGGNRGTAIFIAKVPNGTSADVAITLSGNAVNASVALYSLDGLASAAVADTATSITTHPTASMAVAAGSVMIAVANAGAGGSPSATWTGLTEDCDNNYGASNLQCRSSASGAFATAQTVNATCTFTASGGSAGSFAVFEP